VQGDLDGAVAAYKESLDISRELSSKESENVEFTHGISVSLLLLGDVLAAKGDISSALLAYYDGLKVIRELSSKDRTNTAWQRQLSANLSGFGDALRAHGVLDRALVAYREGLDLIRVLAAKDVQNKVWQSELSMILSKVGDTLAAQHDLNGALVAHREGLDIIRGLASTAQDPRGGLLGMTVSLDKIGSLMRLQFDTTGAQGVYREQLEVLRRLAAKEPNNIHWAVRIATALDTLATVGDDPSGRWIEAVAILNDLKMQRRLDSIQLQLLADIEAKLAKSTSMEHASVSKSDQIQGTYVGLNATSQLPGEHQLSLTFRKSGTDVDVTYQSALGGRGRGTGRLAGDSIEGMKLTNEAPNCAGSYTASLVFSKDTVSWSYEGQDCGGPVKGHGVAKKTGQ
jgi:tetratricopeptide (TPR) repeat protein